MQLLHVGQDWKLGQVDEASCFLPLVWVAAEEGESAKRRLTDHLDDVFGDKGSWRRFLALLLPTVPQLGHPVHAQLQGLQLAATTLEAVSQRREGGESLEFIGPIDAHLLQGRAAGGQESVEEEKQSSLVALVASRAQGDVGQPVFLVLVREHLDHIIDVSPAANYELP